MSGVTKVHIKHHKGVVIAAENFPYSEDKSYVQGEGGKDIDEFQTHTAKADGEAVRIEGGEIAVKRFMRNAAKMRKFPPSQYYYHTYMNPFGSGWTAENLGVIFAYANKHGFEVRAWANNESGLNLVSVKDPDTSEDSGMELYELMEGKYQSYGLASWYEFEEWGVPLDTKSEIRPAANGWGIIIGKGDDMVLID